MTASHPTTSDAPRSRPTARTVRAAAAPAPVGPFSHATVAGGTVYVSGQMGVDPATSQLVDPSDVAAQAKQALTNLTAILHTAGTDLASVVKTTIFLTDMSHFATVNKIYAQWFGLSLPARSCVAVSALPLPGAQVEIEAIAVPTVPTGPTGDAG
ncbi:Rid family detoxifying hydrolase [Streptomyces hygroscopicus]|uniref:Rid family detoxifying hydrolase n=1 Tax=Streptomyces hygroscopicus TaxID=1912 RepID=UPI0036B33A98